MAEVMDCLRVELRPLTAFGTPLAGDTLFGHLCWALRWRHGETALERWLDGYTAGRPFAVVSDAFPAGKVPRPAVPEWAFGLRLDPSQRKRWRSRAWLPLSGSDSPFGDWLRTAESLPDDLLPVEEILVQNTINRLTGATGDGPFAPRRVTRSVFPHGARLEVHLAHDPERIDVETLLQAMEDIGEGGYGRDASAGLGKFSIGAVDRRRPVTDGRNAAITLAPCAADPAALVTAECFWQPVTRFGRHGSVAALGLAGGAFKRPVLMMRTGAFLRLREGHVPAFHGRGLGGRVDPLSAVIPGTVHQGYAPLLPIRAEVSL